MDKCPHCGSDDGYHRRTFVNGETATYYNFDGSIGDNTHLHDHLNYTEQKTMYCNSCRKPLGRVKEL